MLNRSLLAVLTRLPGLALAAATAPDTPAADALDAALKLAAEQRK